MRFHEADQFELPLYSAKEESAFVVYTDGSCLKNPGGAGGWACVVLQNNAELYRLKGGEPSTTNNRQELMGAIKGLQQVPEGSKVTVISDSKYVVCGANKWHKNWVRRNWLNVKNPDLWKELIALKEKRACVFEWIRGHNGDKYNTICDRMANEAALFAASAGATSIDTALAQQ